MINDEEMLGFEEELFDDEFDDLPDEAQLTQDGENIDECAHAEPDEASVDDAFVDFDDEVSLLFDESDDAQDIYDAQVADEADMLSDDSDDDFDDDLSDLYDFVKDEVHEAGFMAAFVERAERKGESVDDAEAADDCDEQETPADDAGSCDERSEEVASVEEPEQGSQEQEQTAQQRFEDVQQEPEEELQFATEDEPQQEAVEQMQFEAEDDLQQGSEDGFVPGADKVTGTPVQSEPGFAIKHPGMVLLIELLLVIGMIACMVGAYSLTRNEEVEQEIILLTQTQHASIDYEVSIRENDFFEDSLLEQDEYYIRSIVEKINSTFNYEYQSTVPGNLLLIYNVTGRVSANYKDSEGEKEVWTQTDILCDTQEYNGEYDEVSFSVPISFDPNKYSEKIESFEQEMGINVVAYYTVTLQVKTLVEHEGESLAEVYEISYELPLSGSVFNVVVEEKEPVYSDLNRSITPQALVNWWAAVPLMLLSFGCLAGLVVFMRRVKREREMYDANFYELVNSINDRIVYVDTPLETNGDSIMISDFDSFLRLADERSLPIFCYRAEDRPEGTMFYVNDSGQQYICPYSAG